MIKEIDVDEWNPKQNLVMDEKHDDEEYRIRRIIAATLVTHVVMPTKSYYEVAQIIVDDLEAAGFAIGEYK